MKKGACFKCEKTGHLAKDHDEFERKEEKRKASTRRTETSTSTTSNTPPKPMSAKRDIKRIHALFQALSTKEKEELYKLESPGKEKEKKMMNMIRIFEKENCLDVSISLHLIYCPMSSSSS